MMSKRSYNQFCPIAYSLDLLGERWTLLIIREMVFGPCRYTDLLETLPGIGTNLLSDRLKRLEEAGIIQQTRLPPPAATAVYELTDHGKELKDPILALAKWGLPLLRFPVPDGELVSPKLALFYMSTAFKPEKATGIRLNVELRVGENGRFQVMVQDNHLELSTMPLALPDLVLSTDLSTLFTLLQGGTSTLTSAEGPSVQLEKGEISQLTTFLSLFL